MSGRTDQDEDESTAVARTDDRGLPTSEEHAYLIVLAGPGVGEVHRVAASRVIGRGQDSDVRLLDDAVSRHHAVVELSPQGHVRVRDLASTNGTFVNGAPITDRVLEDGDKIMVGTTTILKFTYHDHLEETFQRQMYESALRDGLTRAFNERYFRERLGAEIAYSRRHGTPLALMLFDLDQLRRLNERHGHLAGDQVLVTIADALHAGIRAEDVLARVGGGCFAVLSRGEDLTGGRSFAERIRRAVADHPFSFEGARIPVTVSAGVSAGPLPEQASPDALVQAAREALGRAKAAGRDRVEAAAPAASETGGDGTTRLTQRIPSEQDE